MNTRSNIADNKREGGISQLRKAYFPGVGLAMLSHNLTAVCAVHIMLWHGKPEGFLREFLASSSAILAKSKSFQVDGLNLSTATLHG
jgi:hypothetical protein